jgi:Zn-finger nucleic acid-binding protein
MPRCPSCFVPLARAMESGVKQHTCPNCFGHWMNTLALTRLVRLGVNEPEAEVSLVDLAETVAASDNRQAVRCAECEKEMMKDSFHPMIPVRIDKCRKCNTVWLDAGEYALLRALYRELMTSDDPEIVRRREKVATALAQWEGRKTASQEMRDDLSTGYVDPDDIVTPLIRLLINSWRLRNP